jgi:hypothetical protein
MAKIGDLQLGTEKIANGAVTSVIETNAPTTNTLQRHAGGVPPDNTTSIWEMTLAISNPVGKPVQLFFALTVDFPGDGTGSGDSATQVLASLKLTRARDSKVFYNDPSIGPYDGQSHRVIPLSCQTIDMDATTSETYKLTFKYFTNGTQINPQFYPNVPTFPDPSLFAIVVKR